MSSARASGTRIGTAEEERATQEIVAALTIARAAMWPCGGGDGPGFQIWCIHNLTFFIVEVERERRAVIPSNECEDNISRLNTWAHPCVRACVARAERGKCNGAEHIFEQRRSDGRTNGRTIGQ